MRLRVLIFSGLVSGIAAVGWLGSPFVDAQTPAPRAKTPIARTADGHPDLQGVYDVATITPLERPPGVTKLVLSDAEVKAMEGYEAERTEKSLQPSGPNRAAPPVGGDRSPTKSDLEGLFRAGGGVARVSNTYCIAPGD